MLAAIGKCVVLHEELIPSWCRGRYTARLQSMFKVSLLVGAIFVATISTISAASADQIPCKDCSADTGLTVREQIKADRAREADRIAKESPDRPWDGKDFGRTDKAPPPAPATR
jgi:hypothetical protein